jgi:hypothetical protein
MATLKRKIHWFALPLVISLLTWLVAVSYENKAANQVQSTQDQERYNLMQKMWVKLDKMEVTLNANNSILIEKADRKENEKDHERILVKLDEVEKVVNKTFVRKYGYVVIYPDSNLVVNLLDSIPGAKNLSFVNAIHRNP